MDDVKTIGLDLAKGIFQVHGADADGRPVLKRKLRRDQVAPFFARLPHCVVGLEACGTAHHWGRLLRSQGHDVRLIPPAYVKAYVHRNKTDAADAAAICEAVSRPTMRTVPIKSPEQQAAAALHQLRDGLVASRTRHVNALRGHMAEYGLVVRTGIGHVGALQAKLDAPECPVPPVLRDALRGLTRLLGAVEAELDAVEAQIAAQHKASELSQRLATIPGIGPLIAQALEARVIEPARFKSGRDLAAWIGLVPKQNSSGGKDRAGRISKQGDEYLRRLLVSGAQSVLLSKRAKTDPWLIKLLSRKPRTVAAVAVANKLARTAWAVMTKGTRYDAGRRPGQRPAPAGVAGAATVAA